MPSRRVKRNQREGYFIDALVRGLEESEVINGDAGYNSGFSDGHNAGYKSGAMDKSLAIIELIEDLRRTAAEKDDWATDSALRELTRKILAN